MTDTTAQPPARAEESTGLEPTVREAFWQVARELGLTTVLGDPGFTEEPLLKEFPQDLRYVLALQEACAVCMADGYARATGKAALVDLHTAAGIGNAMGMIESAWYNHAPLVITARNQTREMLLLEPFLANPDFMIIPPNVPHEFRLLEHSIDIDFFAPGRQDRLDSADS